MIRRSQPLTYENSDTKQLRKLLCLYHHTSISTEQILDQGSSLFDCAKMLASGVRYDGVRAAGLDVDAIGAFGFNTLESYRRLGLDALDLTNASDCRSLVAQFGADAVCKEFIQHPGDAVAIVGSEGADVLGLTTERLLSVCAGSPVAATTVISRIGLSTVLEHQPPVGVLIDAGLRRGMLLRMGLCSVVLAEKLKATTADLRKLGFGRDGL